MPITLKLKSTTTAGKVPTHTTELDTSELALNLVDKRLFSANDTVVFDAIQNTASSFAITGDTLTLKVGNATVNLTSNSTTIKMMNSTSNTTFTIPTAAEWSAGDYFLNADGSWSQPPGGSASVTIAETAPGGPANGDLWWDSSTGEGVLKIRYGDGTSEQWVDTTPSLTGAQGLPGPASPKSLSLLKPATSDNITIFHTDDAITVSEIRSVVRGSSPSVTATYKWGASRNGVGETVMQATVITSNVTAGNIQSSFTSAAVSANSWVWLEITGTGGTIDEYATKLIFTTT